MKKFLSLFVRILVSVSLMALLFYLVRDKTEELFSALRSTNVALFFAAFLFMVTTLVIVSARLKELLTVQKAHLSLKEISYLTFIGYFFNNFLPTSVGGDFAKAHYASKFTKLKLESFTSVFMDRLIGSATLFVIGLIGAFASARVIKNNTIIYLLTGLVICVFFASFILLNRKFAGNFTFLLKPFLRPRLEEKLKKIYDAINNYKNRKDVIGYALLISIAAQVAAIFAVFFVAKSISVPIPLSSLFFVVPVSGALGMLPSINGLGIREGAFVYCLKNIVPIEKALAVALLFWGLLLLISVVGGLIYLLKVNLKVI